MRILITGGAGYLGSMMAQEFSRLGHVVICFDSLMWNQGHDVYPLVQNKQYSSFYKEDVRDWSDVFKYELNVADVVIPLAALVGAPLCDKFPEDAVSTNEEWMRQLLNYLDDQIVLYPNTNSGYGISKEECTEETPMNPISLYGVTKLNGENILKNYDKFVGFRLATVFGWSYRMRNDLLVNNLVYNALKGDLEIFDANFSRNYIHVRDVARAFNFALKNIRIMNGNVYNLGNDSINCTKRRLAEKICKLVGSNIKEVSNKTDPDKRDYVVSSAKLSKNGYSPVYNLNMGICELRDYYKNVSDDCVLRSRNY